MSAAKLFIGTVRGESHAKVRSEEVTLARSAAEVALEALQGPGQALSSPAAVLLLLLPAAETDGAAVVTS